MKKLAIDSELGWSLTYEGGGLARHPGDEDDLGTVGMSVEAW